MGQIGREGRNGERGEEGERGEIEGGSVLKEWRGREETRQGRKREKTKKNNGIKVRQEKRGDGKVGREERSEKNGRKWMRKRRK